MNWKILAIVLIVVVVLFMCYSFGVGNNPADDVDDGTAETAESFEVSLQSDSLEGFADWLWANLWWLCIAGVGVFLGAKYIESRY